jgi:hypothetical protein
MSNITPYCNGSCCRHGYKEVRRYPRRDGTNLWLCMPCFDYENMHRSDRAKETGHPEDWPQVSWVDALVRPTGVRPTGTWNKQALIYGAALLIPGAIVAAAMGTDHTFMWRFVVYSVTVWSSYYWVYISRHNPWAIVILALAFTAAMFLEYHQEMDIVIYSSPGKNPLTLGFVVIYVVIISAPSIAEKYPREWLPNLLRVFETNKATEDNVFPGGAEDWPQVGGAIAPFPYTWRNKIKGSNWMLKTVVIGLILAYLLFTPNGQMICAMVLIYVLGLFH